MLEGLEISVLLKSELEFENKTKRFDSEYLQKYYLQNIETIRLNKSGFYKLSESVLHLSGGATPLGAEYEHEGIPFIRVQNIMQNFFNLNDVVYINTKQDEEIKRTRLKERDVLLTITGVSYGKSAVVTKGLINANINQHSVKITLNKGLNPYFLSTFLNCKYGKLQSDKNIIGVTRPALDYEVIRNFLIPKLPALFQLNIEKLIVQSQVLIEQSQQAYTRAEQILLFEIGLLGNDDAGYTELNIGDWVSDDPIEQMLANQIPGVKEELELLEADWDNTIAEQDRLKTIVDYEGQIAHFQKNIERLENLNDLIAEKTIQLKFIYNNKNLVNLWLAERKNVNVKSFKESFIKTGRLDAEYYQKKYEAYENLIINYKNGSETLAFACDLNDKNLNLLDNTLYKYIELSNVGNSGEVNACTEELGKNLPSRARRKVNTGDVAISSIEGSLQSCAVIPQAYDNALCSTGFYVIKSKKVNSETLLVLFKSAPMQAILKQNCSGTILTALNKEDFKNIPIPLLDIGIQQQIAALVENSFLLKSESERLLEVAKKAVEIAIEQDEAAAMAYIKDSVKE